MVTLHIDTAKTWRGGQNQALLTVLGLRTLGHRTVLVCHPHGELRRRAAEGPDVLPLAPRTEVDFTSAWRLTRWLRDIRPAVVHAHDPHAVALAALALSFQRVTPAPVLVASRRVDFALKANSFSRLKHRQVHLFICASDAIRQMLVAQDVPESRAVTVHEGVDLDHIAARPPRSLHEEFWLPRGVPVVLNVAALTGHKGQRYLIDAAALVVRERPDTRVVILGEGALRAALEHQVKDLGLVRHVLLPGFRPDVLSLLKTCDVFVMSSVMEGLGTSLLDAMACARPIVATSTGGIPEVVVDGETGLLVPPRDAAALAGAIVTLIDDTARARQLASAGFERVRRQFSAERMVRETLVAYEHVVQSRR
jgi:L-malate glycosyltransferase